MVGPRLTDEVSEQLDTVYTILDMQQWYNSRAGGVKGKSSQREELIPLSLSGMVSKCSALLMICLREEDVEKKKEDGDASMPRYFF